MEAHLQHSLTDFRPFMNYTDHLMPESQQGGIVKTSSNGSSFLAYLEDTQHRQAHTMAGRQCDSGPNGLPTPQPWASEHGRQSVEWLVLLLYTRYM